jgi:ubiquinone/menaquinone biosynthesis C-methylase UbiE
MQQGDFTCLAKDYAHRAGYAQPVLKLLLAHIGLQPGSCDIADVGAGTGKLTEALIALNLSGLAIEPNNAMRAEGQSRLGRGAFSWRVGCAEDLGLSDSSVDWILMGSAFHWTDAPRALAEFRRVLRPGGYFTALWNPRDLDRSDLNRRVDAKIREIVPELRRVSSGARDYTEHLEDLMLSGGLFGDLMFVEAPHVERFTPERYLGIWRSVNDIQAQAGPDRFTAIMDMIAHEVADLDEVLIPYRTRAWTVRSLKAA